MKVRNIVRGGAVVALSLGLASVGTGMGLTAAHSPSKDVTSSPAVATAQTTSGSAVSPDLVCDPGVTCVASWAYFDPGQWCLTLAGQADPAVCTIVTEREQVRVVHGNPVSGCLIGAGTAISWGVLSGPVFDVGGGAFGCVVGGFIAYVD